MDIASVLEEVGFSERESRTYLALLDIGPTTSSLLVRETGIPSSKIYDVLERLEHKGFVTVVFSRGKKEFHAVNPEKIVRLIKDKEEMVQGILPLLKEMYHKTKKEILAEVYKSKEGLKSIFEDIIREKKEWLVMGASGKGIKTLPYYLPHFYDKLRREQVNVRILFVDSSETRTQIEQLRKFNNISIKTLPSQIRNLNVTFIYGDKVCIIPVTRNIELEPVSILIKSKESAESHRDYFNYLWQQAKK